MSNFYTLFPHNEASTEGLVQHENGAYIITFQSERPMLTDDWAVGVEAKTGRSVWVRRADCGAGCRCAGVFSFVAPTTE